MGEPARKLELSYQDYLALERETDQRHEFYQGEAWAMAGGTPRHAALIARLGGAFWVGLQSRPCDLYSSDLKLRVLDTGLATYPDLSVVCGPLERDPEDRNAATNPTLVLEVLSASTEAWDRGAKFAHMRRVPSLRHVVFVNQDTPRVELFTRQGDGSWRLVESGPGEIFRVDDLGVEIPVDALYEGLPEA